MTFPTEFVPSLQLSKTIILFSFEVIVNRLFSRRSPVTAAVTPIARSTTTNAWLLQLGCHKPKWTRHELLILAALSSRKEDPLESEPDAEAKIV